MSIDIFNITIDLPGSDELVKGLNLEEAGKVQRFFSDTILRRSDKYVPFESGILKNSGMVSADGESITYTSPYARYLWYGDLYVDPVYLIGAFHDPVTGRFWSRPGVQKIKDPRGRKLQLNGAPMRGERWVERCWQNESDVICQEVEDFILLNKKI